MGNKTSNIEIEKKYIIEKITEEDLKAQNSFTKSEIEQIYLNCDLNMTRRIRKRVYEDKVVYKETTKIRIDRMSAIEEERDLTTEEYERLKSEIKDGSRPLYKVRYTFVSSGQVFEIDVYPEWQKTCIMETELKSRDEKVTFPDLIKIVKEVTGDKRYTNATMSMRFPEEEII